MEYKGTGSRTLRVHTLNIRTIRANSAEWRYASVDGKRQNLSNNEERKQREPIFEF